MDSNSLGDIYRPYVDCLRKHFGDLAKDATKPCTNLEQLVREYLANDQKASSFSDTIVPDLTESIRTFWHYAGNQVQEVLKRTCGTSTIIFGCFDTPLDESFVTRPALYFETVIMPDPLQRVLLYSPVNDPDFLYRVLRTAITQLLLSDLYLSVRKPPVCVLVPDQTASGQHRRLLSRYSELQFVSVTNYLFDTSFDHFKDTWGFYEDIRTSRDFVKRLRMPADFHICDRAEDSPDSQVEAGARRRF